MFAKNFQITKNLLKIILSMWEKILLIKQDQFTMIKANQKRVFKDVKELREEGIETDIIPWIEDDKN